jgi:hypothetical protein
MDRVDKLLDEIDSLVDESLARGDRSQSYRGEQMQKCRWCPEPWHGLPITKEMVRMRNEPYGWDEFGQPVMDPNYKYSEDTSDWVCPGSDFHGPETPNKSWRLPRGAAAHQFQRRMPGPRLGGNTLRVWRFLPPYDNWNVSLDTRYYEHRDPAVPNRVENTAIFKYDGPVLRVPEEYARAMSSPWFFGIHMVNYSATGMYALPEPISFRYEDVRMHWTDPRRRLSGEDPDWVEFMTSAQLERYLWCGQHWQSRELTAEEKIYGWISGEQQSEAIIDTFVDEAHAIPTEELYDAIQRTQEAAGAAATFQTIDEPRRGSSVFSVGGEVPPSQPDEVED